MNIENIIVVTKVGLVKKTDFDPRSNEDIVGVMVSPKYRETTDIKLSIQDTNGLNVIDPLGISHFADRSVEWGKNYIPLNLPNQKLQVISQYNGEDDEFEEEVEVVFIFGKSDGKASFGTQVGCGK